MVTIAKIDFSRSNIEALRRLGTLLPQLFRTGGEPVREANKYLRLRASQWSRNTLLTNAYHLKDFLGWLEQNHIPLAVASEGELDLYIYAQCARQNRTGAALSSKTIKFRLIAVSQFMKWMHEHSEFSQQSGASSPPPKKQLGVRAIHNRTHSHRNTVPITQFALLEDAVRFIRNFSPTNTPSSTQMRNQLIAALMLESGLRISEVVNFPLTELPEIDVRGSATPARVVGKGNKRRMFLIPNRLLANIWEYVEHYRPRVPASSSEEMVFVSSTGKSITRNWIEKLFAQNSKKCGLSIHPHMLRHTFGTYHYLYNKDIVLLMKLMGHSSEDTTREFYVHTASLVSHSKTYQNLQELIDKIR